MSIERQENAYGKDISTFRMGGKVRERVVLATKDDVVHFFDTIGNRPWLIVGGGSNIVFPSTDSDITIVQLAQGEIEIASEDADSTYICIPAGADWDGVVEFAVSRGLSGIEALSAIPGTAGATPVQNVGAYGTEISDLLTELEAYDTQNKTFVTLKNDQCQFSYRDSIFKHSAKGKYLIYSITLKLSKDSPNVPMYPGVDTYFAERGITRASLRDIRNAITYIRANKLPDPKHIASVGSFFKNPFIDKDHAEKLRVQFPDIKLFPSDAGLVKIPAGWLIERAGFKGKNFGTISVYSSNALVLVNNGGATQDDLLNVVEIISTEVEKLFGITLEIEPEIL